MPLFKRTRAVAVPVVDKPQSALLIEELTDARQERNARVEEAEVQAAAVRMDADAALASTRDSVLTRVESRQVAIDQTIDDLRVEADELDKVLAQL